MLFRRRFPSRFPHSLPPPRSPGPGGSSGRRVRALLPSGRLPSVWNPSSGWLLGNFCPFGVCILRQPVPVPPCWCQQQPCSFRALTVPWKRSFLRVPESWEAVWCGKSTLEKAEQKTSRETAACKWHVHPCEGCGPCEGTALSPARGSSGVPWVLWGRVRSAGVKVESVYINHVRTVPCALCKIFCLYTIWE